MADLALPSHLLVSAASLPAHTSLEVQEKPSVAEVEVSVITVLVHQLKELRVQNLPSKAKGNSSVHTRGTSHSSARLPPFPLLSYRTTTPSTQLLPPLQSWHTLLPGCLYSPLLPTTESSSQFLRDPRPGNSFPPLV